MNRQTNTTKMPKSRVVKIDSEHSWDFFITQANNQGCPVMVHFTAAWCVPSVAMNPLFEELALSYQDVLFLSVDVDDVKGAASKMEITAMPTFVLMEQGTRINKIVGANPDEIRKMIDGFILQFRSRIPIKSQFE
ncbi:C-terminal cysteine residue is changed to a serine 1 [Hibiscus trionum]|uniref:C-terminal cysteine residue is changed to a serine 1 n=1 Tax=Hibiscus trionum TaxID=183268 RepID=A0A9W7JEL7_HIBTR|nr:C-terminal cysteine residue is changed to a serine 1 [Hibiscus trionum]